MKADHFFRKKKLKLKIFFGTVYDLTFILHCFSVSIWEVTHYFCARVFCMLFYWKQGRSSLGESGTRLSWGKKSFRFLRETGFYRTAANYQDALIYNHTSRFKARLTLESQKATVEGISRPCFKMNMLKIPDAQRFPSDLCAAAVTMPKLTKMGTLNPSILLWAILITNDNLRNCSGFKYYCLNFYYY